MASLPENILSRWPPKCSTCGLLCLTGLRPLTDFISFLAALNYYTNAWRYMWFLWAALGWGIGLIFQAFKAFRWAPFLDKNWEERKIKELMDEDEELHNRWS